MKHKLPNVTFLYSDRYQCPIQNLKSLWFYREITTQGQTHTWFKSRKMKTYFVGNEC